MIKSKGLWTAAALFGLATAGLAALIFPTFPTDGHAISEGYGGAVYAMEMARTPADLIAVFGPEGDPARSARIIAMDRGNLWDYAFMPAYAGFMGLFLWAAFRETGRRMFAVFAVIGALSGVADAVENLILLGLTKNLAAAPLVEWLAYPVWIKFFAIALAIGAAGVFMMGRSRFWTVLGTLTLLASLAVPLSFVDASRFGHVAGSGIGIAWVLMLSFAGAKAVKPTL